MASPIMERVVEFNTLKTTFVPQIFESKDWAALFRNFKDLMDELVKECYSNIIDLRVELICWVRGNEFIINPNSIADILHITRPRNMNLTPYVIELQRFKTFYKFLDLTMKSLVKAHP